MPSILVTGASGYVGSTLLSLFPKKWHVLAFDKRAPSVKLPENVEFVRGDITNPIPKKLLRDIEIVVHLATLKGSEKCRVNSMDAIEINVLGTHNLLKSSRSAGVEKFIFASTYWVYDENVAPPYSERSPTMPRELYGLTKLISEIEIANSSIKYVILRFSNLFGYGSGIESDDVISVFIRRGLEGKPIIIYNKGIQKLDFIDVEDACKCVLKIISKSRLHNTILNVGRGEPTSINDIAQIVSRVIKNKTGKSIAVKNVKRKYQPPDRWLSINKLRNKIGQFRFKPLEKTIEEHVSKLTSRIGDSSNKVN